jgi:hypothetical protein
MFDNPDKRSENMSAMASFRRNLPDEDESEETTEGTKQPAPTSRNGGASTRSSSIIASMMARFDDAKGTGEDLLEDFGTRPSSYMQQRGSLTSTIISIFGSSYTEEQEQHSKQVATALFETKSKDTDEEDSRQQHMTIVNPLQTPKSSRAA